ncbi:MAG TPA: PQQ-binding-like beta-propeller repeat protein [Bryobacteraceae bacterium]
MKIAAVVSAALFAAASLASAADPDAAALYKQRCAICHEASAQTRAPAPAALRLMSPENELRALESGVMKEQGADLSAADKRALAEFLTAKTIGSAAQTAKPGACADPKAPFSLAGPQWNGWGAGDANARFQPAGQAGLTATDVPRLKLKWAFAFPNTFTANGQPVIAGGRIFVASANRNIYSLDAKTGCQYWSIETQAPVRTAVVLAAVEARTLAFFGDQRGNAYAVDAAGGELLWKVHLDEHPMARIVGAPAYHAGRLYVPLTAAEEGPAMSPAYQCCSARGAVVALDAATGKQIWKTYTIAEQPHPVRKNGAGTQMWGPSGASVWTAPTFDPERNAVYVGTGDNFSEPATATSDAVMAFDADSGKILWVKQLTEGDVFNMACVAAGQSCPEKAGPDFDIGASPILVKLGAGKRALLISQKSAAVHALDPDHEGAILWKTRVGRGGPLGGIQWGSAFDGKNMYVALSDITFAQAVFGAGGGKLTLDSKVGGGLFALDAATGNKVWSADPPVCGDRPQCSPAQSAAVSAIPGAVFSGSVDGHLRAYSTADGKVIWDYDTTQQVATVTGATAKGGSMDGPGPAIAGGMLFVCSGYGAWGGLPGNVLLAFSVDGK